MKAEEILIKHLEESRTYFDTETGVIDGVVIDYILNAMEQYASQEKEEVESGWVVMSNLGVVYHDTLSEDEKTAWGVFCLDDRLDEWITKEFAVDEGYKCVQATRITRLTKTTKK